MLEKLRDKKIILFGTENMGNLLYKYFASQGLDVACFSDNLKTGVMNGAPILSPGQAWAKFDNPVVVVTAVNEFTRSAILNQLAGLGCDSPFSWEQFYPDYLKTGKKRDIDHESFSHAVSMIYSHDKHILKIPMLTMPITTVCNLKCKHCSYFMPRFEKPRHFSKDDLIQNIRRFAECVDVINVLTILGGEAFTHPELSDILASVSSIPNIVFIQVITNCTIIPADKTLKVMADNAIGIAGSDYGAFSAKQNGLYDTCVAAGVNMSIRITNKTWSDFNCNDKTNRSAADNSKLFKSCWNRKICSQLYRGEFHLCNLSAIKMDLGMIPRVREDYVVFNDETLNMQALRQEMKNLLNSESYISACDFCHFGKVIPVAEQA